MGKHKQRSTCNVEFKNIFVVEENLFSLICDGDISHDQVSLKSMNVSRVVSWCGLAVGPGNMCMYVVE